MACSKFPKTGLVANVTTHQVGDVTYIWTGVVWESITVPLKHSQLSEKDVDGAHDSSSINHNGSDLKSAINSFTSSIAFVFDDAYQSTLDVLLPMFNARGLKFGSAIPIGSLGNPNRLTISGLLELSRSGVEIINHASTGDLMNSAAGSGKVLGEIATCWSYLSNLGVNPSGFQTPSSSLDQSYLDIVRTYSDYAFTVDGSQSILPTNTDRYKLKRFSIESATLAECESIVESLTNITGGIVFYAHDIVNGDANYLKIQAILDKASSLSIPVLSPSQCIDKSISKISPTKKQFVTGKVIDNNPRDYNSSPATNSVGSNMDITVSIPSAGSYLVQKVVNIYSIADFTQIINFSAEIRELTAGIIDTAAIAIKLYNAVDGGGSLIDSTTEQSINLGAGICRYMSEINLQGAKSALVYIRLVCNAAGNVLVREPILRTGTSIEPVRFIDSKPSVTTFVVPTQTITAGGTYNAISLTPDTTNPLYSVTTSGITFLRNATVNIAPSFIASGAGVGVGFSGGTVAMTVAGNIVAQSPIGGGDSRLAGCSSMTIKVARGSSISFLAAIYGTDFHIGASNSRISVSEI